MPSQAQFLLVANWLSQELYIYTSKHVLYNTILRIVSRFVLVYNKTYELSHMFLFCAIGYLKYLIDRDALRTINDTKGITDHVIKFIQAYC